MSARIVLSTLNARYIHASLGLRYLLANMPLHGGPDLADCTQILEFSIRRPLQEVAEALLAQLDGADTQILGLGVYIWNVNATTALVRRIRQLRPSVRIVLGGPEVSHELDAQEIVALADHVITGWGDVSFPRLCKALVHGPSPLMKVIAGEQPPLESIALPYAAFTDDDLAHRVLYVEASRGCPFRCSFCLSALDRTAWPFDLDHFLGALDSLYERGARTFKFVDRTFNLKAQTGARILDFFLECMVRDGTAVFLHFELVPDHLPEALKERIRRFPPGALQFEIGIQTWDPAVQQRIARRQDNALAEDNIRWLATHSRAHLHVDLIMGLPGETWDGFARGFDRLWALGPQEIQLGLLKRLRGTPLASQCARGDIDGMLFDPQPPYALLCNATLDAAQVQAFARLARYWDLVANSGRFARTLPLVLRGPSAFAAFARFSEWLWQRDTRTQGFSPEQLVDALAAYLVDVRGLEAAVVLAALRADYDASGARGFSNALRGASNTGTATAVRARGMTSNSATTPHRQRRHMAQVHTTEPLPTKIAP